MARQQSLASISTKLLRVAKLARERSELTFTSLHHLVDMTLLKEAFRLTRKDGAVGVDGQSSAAFSEDLDENLAKLLLRFKSGTYRAPAVRRVYIPKDGGQTRPIGIPTFEDKVFQRAVTMVLESIYEEDFRDSSYGFRPRKNAHQALEAVYQNVMDHTGGWVLDVDIQGFFDALDHSHLRAFLDERVRDGVLRRMLDKWLKAGVLEEGGVSRSRKGTPQGGVISPLLANVYLHHVLDVWFEDEIKPRLRGKSSLVRYADDFIIVCEREAAARRVMAVLPKRFGKYGLTLRKEKTRLLPFVRPLRSSRGKGRMRTGQAPGTFDFLGFTHFWRKSRRGNWYVTKQISKSRFRRALKGLANWCRKVRHWPLQLQHKTLCRKLRGHDAYYGVTGNSRKLAELRRRLRRIWRRNLRRRSQQNHMPMHRFLEILERFPFASPTTVHSVMRSKTNA